MVMIMKVIHHMLEKARELDSYYPVHRIDRPHWECNYVHVRNLIIFLTEPLQNLVNTLFQFNT